MQRIVATAAGFHCVVCCIGYENWFPELITQLCVPEAKLLLALESYVITLRAQQPTFMNFCYEKIRNFVRSVGYRSR